MPIENGFGKGTVVEVMLCDTEEEAVTSCALEACRILERECFLKEGTIRNWDKSDYSTGSQSDFSDSAHEQKVEKNNRIEAMVKIM